MNLEYTQQVRSESFSKADHQLLAMKTSYEAEEIAIDSEVMGERETQAGMLLEYQRALDDETIEFVDDVPQYLNTTAEVESGSYLMEGMPGRKREVESGHHINSITRGDPSDPDEIVVVIPGTDFSDGQDVQQTLFNNPNNRTFDYSEEAIEYVGDLKEKYPAAKITVDGHSLAGKIVIQIGMTYPDVQANAYNPTALDKDFRKMADDDANYYNINVFVYDQEIAGVSLGREARYRV